MDDNEAVWRLGSLAEEYERCYGRRIEWKEIALLGLSQTMAVPILERMLDYGESAEAAVAAVYGDGGG